MKIFDDPKDVENSMYNNFRVYGTILLYCMGTYKLWFNKIFTKLFSFHVTLSSLLIIILSNTTNTQLYA